MKIGYNKAIGTILILLGLFNCCLGAIFVRAEEGSVPAGVVAGFWFGIVFGLLFLTRTYIEVTKDTLVVRALLGFATKKYMFNSPKDFAVKGKRILLSTGGETKPLAISSWLAERRGWASLIQWIQTSKTP